MNRQRRISHKLALGFLVFVLAGAALTAQTKIRVKDPNAVIRIEPAANGEVVMDKLAVGTVFTVERKTGPWFEVKYRSAIGVLLTGYIHESAVEEVKPEPEIKPETPPQPKPEPRVEPAEPGRGLRSGLEIGLSGGMGFPSFSSGSGTLYNSGSMDLFSEITDTGTVSFSLKSPVDLAASFAYFFSPSFGFRLQVDMPLKQNLQSGTSNYTLRYRILSFEEDSFSPASWPLTGDFSVIPISLNGVFRFAIGSNMNAYITAGPAYFMGKINDTATSAFAWSWWVGTTQYLDYIPMPISINQTINGIGFNAGAGIDLFLGDSFGLFFEAAYFAGPSADESWVFQPGTYRGATVPSIQWTVSQAAIDALGLSSRITPLAVKLSFMKAAAGVKIRL